MALQTYAQTRPWAAAIREQVLSRRMPPWDADPNVGHFAHDRSLSKADIDTLSAWAASGAKEGRAADAPAPRRFLDGWNISQPDLVLRMEKPFHVPASREVDYQYIVVPTKFEKDTWVQMAEVRPSERSVVHHAVVFVREPNSRWLRGDIGGLASDILLTYTPGMVPRESGSEGHGAVRRAEFGGNAGRVHRPRDRSGHEPLSVRAWPAASGPGEIGFAGGASVLQQLRRRFREIRNYEIRPGAAD